MEITIGELIDEAIGFDLEDTVDADHLILMVKDKQGQPVGWIEPDPAKKGAYLEKR